MISQLKTAGSSPKPPQQHSLRPLAPSDGVFLRYQLEVVGEKEARHHEECERHEAAVEQDLLDGILVGLQKLKRCR